MNIKNLGRQKKRGILEVAVTFIKVQLPTFTHNKVEINPNASSIMLSSNRDG
jgi:hypothetical protein